MPQRIYHGSAGGATRYFPIKLPLSGGRPTTFVYIDPGNETDTELRYWGEQHEALWTGLRRQGIPVHVVGIARDGKAEDRTDTVLNRWARERGPVAIDGSVEAQELRRELAEVTRGIHETDPRVFNRYDGFNQTLDRYDELVRILKKSPLHNIRIDTFEVWRSERILAVGEEGTVG